MVKPIPTKHSLFLAHPRISLVLVVTVGLLMLTGCAGPLASERDAFERWHQLDEQTYRMQTRTSEGQPAEEREERRVLVSALPDEPTLADYLRYAAEHNPGLQAAFEQWKAALERVPQARALMDPRLSYSYFVRESMTQQTVSLSQAFPWYGTLRARGDVALEQALAAEQRFDAQLQAVRLRVKQAYAEYAYLAQALTVMQENHRTLQDLEAGAQARFEAGEVPYADVVRAGVAVEQALDDIHSLEARRPALVGRLNAALGRSANRRLPWPEPVTQVESPMDEAQLLAELGRRNPELQALQHEATSRSHAVRLARQNRIPDLMLGVEYMDMVPENMRDQVAVMGAIDLPIWGGRLDAERAEALAEFGAATRRQTDRQNELEAELRQAWYRFRDTDRQAALFEQTLIPMSTEAMEATEAAYGAGEAEFQAVTQAQTALQEMQLTYERAVADRFQALAQIEQLVGQSLMNDDLMNDEAKAPRAAPDGAEPSID